MLPRDACTGCLVGSSRCAEGRLPCHSPSPPRLAPPPRARQVLPWMVSDSSSPTLDLTSPASFRDLSKPVGQQREGLGTQHCSANAALNVLARLRLVAAARGRSGHQSPAQWCPSASPCTVSPRPASPCPASPRIRASPTPLGAGALEERRLQFFLDRFESLRADAQHSGGGGGGEGGAHGSGHLPPFHYGTHYSSAGIVLFYLIRLEGFTKLNRQLQVWGWGWGAGRPCGREQGRRRHSQPAARLLRQHAGCQPLCMPCGPIHPPVSSSIYRHLPVLARPACCRAAGLTTGTGSSTPWPPPGRPA